MFIHPLIHNIGRDWLHAVFFGLPETSLPGPGNWQGHVVHFVQLFAHANFWPLGNSVCVCVAVWLHALQFIAQA